MARWVAADADSPDGAAAGRAVAAPSRSWTTAIPAPNRASANIGDHIQSIAALGHLVRHRGVRLHGDAELVALLEQLGEPDAPRAAARRTSTPTSR